MILITATQKDCLQNTVKEPRASGRAHFLTRRYQKQVTSIFMSPKVYSQGE